MAYNRSKASFALLAVLAALSVSCARYTRTVDLIPSSPRPWVLPPSPTPMVDEPPPLLAAYLPAKDPALALLYAHPVESVAPPRRAPDRAAWRRNSGRLIEEFQARELESLIQASESASQQSDEILLEELLRLTIPEDSRLSPELHRVLASTRSDLPLALNEQVLRYVNYFLGRGRNTMRATLKRAGAYRPMINRVLAEHGVPQDLIYLVQAESGFQPKARSVKRATGMWQFVSWRGKEYGLNQNRQVDERLDPEKATVAAARHLADLYSQFGNWYLAMAAYNAGPGRVQGAVERTGFADYWEFVKRGVLPRETSNYVPAILAMLHLGKNAEAFGLNDLPPEPPIHYDTVATFSRIGLTLVGDITGATVARVKQLNPALLGSATPDGLYALRIPKNTASRFQAEIARIPDARRISWRLHEVREGENVIQIAARYRVKPEDIRSVNELGAGQPAAGERLTIPVPYRAEPARSGSKGVTATAGQYTVKSGDTLGAIARRHRVTVAQLQQWNRIPGARLAAGQVLNLRPASQGPARRQIAATRSPRTSNR